MAQQNNGLPSGWEVRMSNSRALPYYFSPTTQASRWEPPDGTDGDTLSRYLAENFAAPSQPTGSEGSSNSNTIRAAHLLVKHDQSRRPASWREKNITRTKEEAIERLRGFEQQIRSKQTTLGELATTESDCPSASKKGDLGFFGKDAMQKEFEKAAFALQPGEMSGIVETASGVHLIERLE